MVIGEKEILKEEQRIFLKALDRRNERHELLEADET